MRHTQEGTVRTNAPDVDVSGCKPAIDASVLDRIGGTPMLALKGIVPEGCARILIRRATGTLARGRKNKQPTQREASRVVRDEQSRRRDPRVDEETEQEQEPEEPEPRSQTGLSRREMSRVKEATRRDGTQQLKRPKKKPLSPAAAASVVIIGVVVLIVAVFFAVRATAVLTVTTVPHGAQVTLDDRHAGTAEGVDGGLDESAAGRSLAAEAAVEDEDLGHSNVSMGAVPVTPR